MHTTQFCPVTLCGVLQFASNESIAFRGTKTPFVIKREQEINNPLFLNSLFWKLNFALIAADLLLSSQNKQKGISRQ